MPKYELSEMDKQLLNHVLQNHQRTIAGILSHITDSKGYKVTKNTKIQVSQDLTEIEVSEIDGVVEAK